MDKAPKKKKKLSDKRKLRDFFIAETAGLRSAPPRCRHFGDCGGCEFQDVPYPAQLTAKRAAFDFIAGEVIRDFREKSLEAPCDDGENIAARELRSRADLLEGALTDISIEVVASPMEYGYRQRMDYVFAFGKAGLRRANRHRQVVELEECPLLGEAVFAVMTKVRDLVVAAGLESYDYMRHTGEVRYFVLRRSRSGEVLLSIVTKSRSAETEVRAILSRLVEARDITSGHWLLAEGLGDVSFGEPLAYFGNPWIVETMNGVDLRIGPNTFFQSNPAVAEKAYAAITAFAPENGMVLDMYSGVGSIAASVAAGAREVVAVENVPENVALAETNIRENGLANVRLVNADSAVYLDALSESPDGRRPDMVIVNPPRPGVEGGGMRAIAGLGPERLAYLSCNPFTLLRNLTEVLAGYRLRALTIYDMFPQTRHFESLALLEKK